MAEEEPDFSHLPITERATHKNWKVRKAAYEEAAAGFAKTPDESDPYFYPWIQEHDLWKKVVMDSNVAAQQEGIAALCSFLQYGGENACTRTRSSTIGPLVEKGLTSTRAATKGKALEAILLYVELDVPAPIINDLLPFMSHKMPKLVTATVNTITHIFMEFGARTVDPKPVLKVIPKLFLHADKNVRAETTALCLELYKWLKDAIKPMFFNDLKPVQQKELEDAFEKVKGDTPKANRLLRSQQIAQAAAQAAGTEEEAEEEEDAPVIDAFDLAEPVNVTAKMSKDFYDLTASVKWKERKDALDDLLAIASVPRIKEDDFNELMRVLAKSMKDANIAVVTVAANCIDAFAKGLKKGFGKYRSVVTQPVLERLKEKKQSVVEALVNALDGIFDATSLTECLEDILEYLKHKNPQVKLETVRFLIRCLKNTRVAPTKQEMKAIADAVSKLLGDTSEPVRSGSAEAMGTLMKIMGERQMAPLMDGLDEIRKVKIKEFFETAVVKAKDKPPPPPPPPAAKAPPKKMMGKPGAKPGAAPAKKPGGVPSKLAPPKAATPGGLKLQKKPAGGNAPPSPKHAPVPSPTFDEPPPAPAPTSKLGFGGRGLTSRPLSNAQQGAPQPVKIVDNGLAAAERVELEELRAEKEKLLRQIADDKAEKGRLLQEISDLQIQNAQLIEEHTRDNLSIRAKEAQLVRARSDAEQAESQVAKYQREMERLKRELSRSVRASSPAPPDISEQIYRDSSIRDSTMSGYGSSSSLGHHGMDSSISRQSKRLSYASTFSEEKENGYERHKMVSPPLSAMSTGSGGRDSPSLSSRAQHDGGNVESWKRAAEVTNQLKMRIEQMKRQNGIGNR